MKSQSEIQMAHDTLHFVIATEIPEFNVFDDEASRERAHIALDALCWVLGHESGEEFEKDMKLITTALYKHGYSPKFVEHDPPASPPQSVRLIQKQINFSQLLPNTNEKNSLESSHHAGRQCAGPCTVSSTSRRH